jgi:hypothetical protein
MAETTVVYTHKGCGGVTVWDLSGGYCTGCGTENLDRDDTETPALPELPADEAVWVTCPGCSVLVPGGMACGQCGRPL